MPLGSQLLIGIANRAETNEQLLEGSFGRDDPGVHTTGPRENPASVCVAPRGFDDYTIGQNVRLTLAQCVHCTHPTVGRDSRSLDQCQPTLVSRAVGCQIVRARASVGGAPPRRGSETAARESCADGLSPVDCGGYPRNLGRSRFEVIVEGERLSGISDQEATVAGFTTRPVIMGRRGDEALLGALTLEALGLVLDPFKRELHPMRLMLA